MEVVVAMTLGWKMANGESEATEPQTIMFVRSTERVWSTQAPFSKWKKCGERNLGKRFQ